MSSIKQKLQRSFSTPNPSLDCDLKLTGISVGLNPELKYSKSLQEDSPKNESSVRALEPRAITVEEGLKKSKTSSSSACHYVIRWPSECQVLPYRIRHIKSLPSSPEVFYDTTGKEAQPRPLGEEHGGVVYHYKPNNQVNYFSRSVAGGSPTDTFSPPVRPPGLPPNCLVFESRFECGNLEKAIRITDTYYELHLRPDFYTARHCQWFYFQVQNMRPDVKYRVSIVNFTKPDSLYTCGMKPVLYSKIEADRHFVGWTRVGDNIRYYKNDTKEEEEDEGPTYTLTFTLTFPHTGDTVYLAHCYPYRYSDLTEDLLNIQSNPERAQFCSQRLLCRTLAGNNVQLLTISTPDCLEEVKGKICIVLSARVHPGETPSSWMMRGVIQFLTGNSETAAALRERFVFKIVPMLNPDGVIIGNTRCNLAGRDLNRQYKNVIKEAFPPVHQTKIMIRKLMEESSIGMYCDFHAHSRKFNIFMYGCENRRHSDRYLKEQIFPLMLHKNASDKFSFESSKFNIQRSKESTGRVVFWNMGILNSFTLEASYGGSNLGSRAFTHFTTGDYQSLGRYFCETLHDLYDPDPPTEQLRCTILQRLIKEESTANEPVNIALSDYSSLSSSGGSDSDENITEMDGDSITIARRSLIKRRRKKKRNRSNFYSTNYSEFLTPDNYTVEAKESSVKKSSEDPENNPSTEIVINSPARDHLASLTEDLSNINVDSGESTSTDDINDDLDYLNLVFQEPTLSDLEPDGFVDPMAMEDQSEEFTALSCEKVHSEILASVNKIRSSILNSRKNFLSCQNLSIDGSSAATQTSSDSTPAKSKTKAKVKKSEPPVSSAENGTLKSNKKKKKVQKTNKVASANSKKKEINDSKSDATPFKARTFYRKAGNITKLEVFLHQDTKKKRKKKAEAEVSKNSTS